MTAFLQCFWILSQIGVASDRNLMSSFEKRYSHSAQKFREQISGISQSFQILEPGFQIFQIPYPIEMCFGAQGPFWLFSMSNILPICLTYWQFSINLLWSVIKVDRIYLPVNMALALFHKHLHKHRNIFERGIREIGLFFVLYCLLVLPIGPCYSAWNH